MRVTSLEQLRDLFDRNEIGLVLIGLPGMEKRLARYPQLYSRIGFVHAFRPLRADEIRHLLTAHWGEMGLALPAKGITDMDAVAAVIRITGGNFRLLRRLLSQIDRILGVNGLTDVTVGVVEVSAITQFDGLVFRAFDGHGWGAGPWRDFPVPVPERCRDAGKRNGKSALGRRSHLDCRRSCDQWSARR